MKSLHQRSGSGVAVLGPVRLLMEDTLSKPSEHVRLCVEQLIVPYLGMILLNCFRKMFKIVQFYCYSFRTVKWSHSYGVVDNYCTPVDAKKCAKLRASKILRIA